MAFKTWPVVRDLRFMQKCGRYLHGARKRRPDLNWEKFRRVAERFKTDDMGSFPERGYLFQLACDLPANAQVIEVGSWMGASTCFIAAGLKGDSSRVHAVDNFEGLSTCGEDAEWYRRHLSALGASSTLDIFNANITALGFSRIVEPVVSDSKQAGQSLARLRGTVDFIFIDGDHSYEGCRADIETWAPFVKPGGVMAFHDFGSRASGVTQAIFEAVRGRRFNGIVGVANTIIAFLV